MQTKAFRRFENRSFHFDADIEVVDVVKRANDRGVLHSAGSLYMFNDIRKANHPTLAARGSGTGSRESAITHLRATLYASYIKDLYEDAMAYLADVLHLAAKHGIDPERFIGEHNVEFDAVELLNAKTWPVVVRLISDKLFRALENIRDTKKLLKRMDAKLGLEIDNSKIDAALPYFEIRHLLVHADGKVDARFAAAFPKFKLLPGSKVDLNVNLVRSARKAVFALLKEFDDKVIASGVVARADCSP